MYAHTPVRSRIAKIKKKNSIFGKKHFFLSLIGMTGTFFALFWCLCVTFSLSFYYSIILKGSMAFFSGKHCTLPTTLEMSEINNQLLHFPAIRIKCRLMCWKCPAENAGNGISKTLNLKNFLGEQIYTSASKNNKSRNVFNQYNRCSFLYSGKPASFMPRNKIFQEIFLIFIRIYFKWPWGYSWHGFLDV